MSKDPEDFTLERLEFKPMKVPAFDSYLCEEVEPTVNQVVDICNDFNGAIDEVKEACAIACGAFKVDVALGGRERDTVILQLTKGDGSQPSAEELATLSADAKATDADAKLAKARSALHKATESSYVALKVEGDVLVADGQAPREIDAFNTALGELRAAIGGLKVSVTVKTAGSPGATCVRTEVQKPVFGKGKDSYSMVPVGVIDVAKSAESKAQIAAENTLAEAVAGLTRAVKTAEAAGASVSFSLKRRKLVAAISGGDEEAASAKATVCKATTAANSQLFKLYKSSRNSIGVINLTKALVTLIDAVKSKIEELTKGTGKQVKDILKVNPNIDFNLDEGVTFDLGVNVDLPDFSGLDSMSVLTKLLPGAAKMLLDSLLKMKDTLVEMIPQFKELAEKIESLVSKAGEVFEDPGEKIKEAFGDGENSDPFAIPKAVAAATSNARTVAVEPVKIVMVFKDTVVRVGQELSNGVAEVKAML